MNEFSDSPKPLQDTAVNAGETMTFEQIKKCDQDIRTFVTLGEYAQARGYALVIGGGYATEAHCGGRMTRPHGDMDVDIFTLGDASVELNSEKANIAALLDKEDTKWVEFPNPGKIEFREDAPDKIWRERRRLELDIANKKLEKQTQKKFLIDSQGNKVEVYVEDINYLVAKKVRLIRPDKSKDVNDQRRIVTQADFNKDICLRWMMGYYSRHESLTEGEAQARTNQDWIKAITLLAV